MADLQSGIKSVTISDYIGDLKLSVQENVLKPGLESVPAQEEVRDGHPYFLSPGKGKRPVFTETQKARAVDYRLYEFDEESISKCARKCNLSMKTLVNWTSERDSKQTSPV
ncbi:MAG: hypothetical protein OXF02_03600 [Simkaniaceae bacterium]|nr:hypothetical protein [Simkaniaceae bacterium]